MQLLIIVTGGAVRLTGSGLGCSTWPLCEPGSFTPVEHPAASIHPYIEFGNRVLSAVVVAAAVAAFVLIWLNRRELSRGFVVLGAMPVLGVLIQAVVGGITVRMSLHPAIVGSHYLMSAALVSVSTWIWVRWRTGDGPVLRLATSPLNYLAAALATLAAVTIVLGVIVTGTGPHSGDTEVGYRFAVDPLWATRLHSSAMWAFLAVLIAYVVAVHRLSRSDDAYRPAFRGGLLIVWVVAAQAGLGFWQYFTGLPEAVVLAHLLGSALFTLAVTYGLLQLRPRRPAPRSLEEESAATFV